MIQMSQLADMHFKQLLLPLSDIRKNAFMINIKSRYQQKNISYNERKNVRLKVTIFAIFFKVTLVGRR